MLQRIRQLDNHVRVLEAERTKYSALFNYSKLPFIAFDLAQNATWTNADFDRQLERGMPGTDPQGKACHQVLCRKKTPCPDCPVNRSLREGVTAQHEMNVFQAPASTRCSRRRRRSTRWTGRSSRCWSCSRTSPI